MSKDKALELGLKPRFKVLARSIVGSDPTLMLTGPIEATKQVLKKQSWKFPILIFLKSMKLLLQYQWFGLKEIKADPSKLNPNGGLSHSDIH